MTMGHFSGVVKLTDLNDFITPAQACVVSLSGKKTVAASVAPAEVRVLKPAVCPLRAVACCRSGVKG